MGLRDLTPKYGLGDRTRHPSARDITPRYSVRPADPVVGDGPGEPEPSLWTPAALSWIDGIWYDMADTDTITVSNGRLVEVADKSGSGHNGFQDVAGKRPLYGASHYNDLPSATWDFFAGGGFKYMVVPVDGRVWNDLQIFHVGYYDNDPQREAVIGLCRPETVGAGYMLASAQGSSLTVLQTGNTVGSYMHNGHPDPWQTRGQVWGASAEQLGLIQQLNVNMTNSMFSLLSLNGYGNSSGRFVYNGDVCEVIAFEGALAADDRQKIEGYLAHKWGFAHRLPSGHPYEGAAPLITA